MRKWMENDWFLQQIPFLKSISAKVLACSVIPQSLKSHYQFSLTDSLQQTLRSTAVLGTSEQNSTAEQYEANRVQYTAFSLTSLHPKTA